MSEYQERMKFYDGQESFAEAIRRGILSSDPMSWNYAGRYMYMGHWDGIAQFKNIETREYLKLGGNLK